MLVVSIASYDAPSPPNAFAAEDAARFAEAFSDGNNLAVHRVDDEPRNSVDLLKEITAFLANTRPGGPDRNLRIVYLSAHGVVNGDGEPCLLLPGHSALDAKSWLPMAQVLSALKTSRSGPDGKILLLLDANRIDNAWRMGVVVNTFSAALERLLEKSPPEHCVVITAASGLHAAVAAPEMSGTPFGLFAARGLGGEANNDGDSFVTLGELENYLAAKVDAWDWQYRGRQQRPRRIAGNDEQLKLANVAGTARIATQAWKSPIEPGQFRSIYDDVRQLEESRVYEVNPLGWAKLQDLLERLDAEALAGEAYRAKARGATLLEATNVIKQLKEERHSSNVTPMSLAMRTAVGAAAPAADLAAVWQKWLQDPKTEVKADYDSAASFAWDQLAGSGNPMSPVQRTELGKALEFADLTKARVPDFTEMALLRLLDRHVDWSSPAVENGVPRQLLNARQASERLAAPVDSRQHYALKSRVAPLDERWATAFDQVLVGDDESLHQAAQSLGELLGDGPAGYGRLVAFSEHVRQGLQARDQALAAALTWNEWWVHRAEREGAVRDNDDVPALVEGALGLAACLDEMMTATADGNSPQVEDQLQGLIGRLADADQRLAAAYNDRIEAVTREEQGSRGLTAMETPELLRCRVGPGEGRLVLHELWMKRLTGKTADAAPMPAGSHSPDAAIEADHELEYLRWAATQGVAPLRQVLDDQRYRLDGSAGASSTAATIDSRSTREAIDMSLAALGERIRSTLRDLDKQCQELAGRTSSALADQPASTARGGLSQADVRSRGLAALAAGTPSVLVGGEAIAGRLRAIDAQAWVLWQGQRALDDCWGSWQVGATRGNAYFMDAAALAADDAEDLAPEARFGPADLRRRTQEEAAVVSQWQPLEGEDLFVYDDGGGFKPHPLKFRGSPAMRPGDVAVYLTDDRGELFRTYGQNNQTVRRAGAEMRANADLPSDLELRSLADVPSLMANALFRGHIATSKFSVGYGVRVDWERPASEDASVVVRGDEKQISEIVFILDCSGSMNGRGFDHVKDGRDVLKGILRRLIKQGDQFRVGLIVFGRRAGWSENPPGSAHRYDAKYLNPEAWRGSPGNDVERPIRLDLLTEQHAAKINDFLETAKGNGETPLYYALAAALDEFSADPGVSRHIVAITDGVDQVTKDDPRYPVTEFKPDDVLRRLANRPTRIDVVEFGIDESSFKNVDLEAGRRNLKTITESAQSGGAWQQAQDTAALEEALLNSLKLDKYGLQRAGDDEPTSAEFAELGTATEINAPLAPQDFFVHLQSRSVPPAPIRIEGGEALELIYQRLNGNRLVYPIYQADRALSQTIETSRGPVRVTPHTSDLTTSSEAIFHLSIQSGDERRFSRRPEVIWAKVTPQSASGDADADRSYYFVDREFQRGKTVPILNLRAAGWPGRKAARIELCFAPDAAALGATTLSIPALGEATGDVDGATLKARMREIAGSGYEIVVDERHPPGGENFPLHLRLEPPADSVSHVYFEADGSAHHVYRYRSVNRPEPQLRVLTRRQIQEGDGGAHVVFDNVEFGRR